jgi:hypothetical protein
MVIQKISKKNFRLFNQFRHEELADFQNNKKFKIINWPLDSIIWKLIFLAVLSLNVLVIFWLFGLSSEGRMLGIIIIITLVFFLPFYIYVSYRQFYILTNKGFVRICYAFGLIPHFRFGRLWGNVDDVKFSVRKETLYLYFPYLSKYNASKDDKALLFIAKATGTLSGGMLNRIDWGITMKIKTEKKSKDFIISKLKSKNRMKFKDFKRFL